MVKAFFLSESRGREEAVRAAPRFPLPTAPTPLASDEGSGHLSPR